MEGLDRLKMAAQAANIDQDIKLLHDTSMGSLQFWMSSVILTCCVLVLAATFGVFRYKKALNFWGKEGSTVVRGYLQKMAAYNLFVLGILYLTYVFVFDGSSDRRLPDQCLRLGEHELIAFILVCGSLVVGLVRFLAVGFAHSEGYDFSESKVVHQSHLQEGFSAQTNEIYTSFINPYLKTALAVVGSLLVFLFVPFWEDFRSSVLNAEFCLTGWIRDGSSHPLPWRLLPVAVIILLPMLSAIVVEHVAHVFRHGYFTKVPGYYSILNAPFIMVALTTTWSMWFVILFIVWLTFGLGAGEYFSMLALFYTSCDSFLLLVATVVVGRKNRLGH